MGARPVGLDVSEGQLATARELQREYGVDFPLLHASAEAAPLPDASFDIAFSEYGAAIWCDPYLWIPEAHRLLRPGAVDLPVQLGDRDPLLAGHRQRASASSAPSSACTGPTGETPRPGLAPPPRKMRALRDTGFEVEALHELQAPQGPEDERRYYLVRGWARRWPGEEVWVARKVN